MTPRRDSAGFTLVELLITSIIVGIVTFAVGTALLIGIKTTFETGERLGQSNSSQLLGQYLLPDIASAAPGGVNTSPGAPFGCSGPAPAGPSVLALTWTNEFTGSATRAVYRYEAPDLLRYTCTPGGSPSRTTVARELKLAPVVSTSGTAVVLTATVVQQQSSGDDYTFTVRASLRTPAGGCEPEQSSLVVTPVPVALSGSNLATALTVTFGTSGPCTAATVDYQYGSTAATRPATVTLVAPGNWEATVPSGGGGRVEVLLRVPRVDEGDDEGRDELEQTQDVGDVDLAQQLGRHEVAGEGRQEHVQQVPAQEDGGGREDEAPEGALEPLELLAGLHLGVRRPPSRVGSGAILGRAHAGLLSRDGCDGGHPTDGGTPG